MVKLGPKAAGEGTEEVKGYVFERLTRVPY